MFKVPPSLEAHCPAQGLQSFGFNHPALYSEDIEQKSYSRTCCALGLGQSEHVGPEVCAASITNHGWRLGRFWTM